MPAARAKRYTQNIQRPPGDLCQLLGAIYTRANGVVRQAYVREVGIIVVYISLQSTKPDPEPAGPATAAALPIN